MNKRETKDLQNQRLFNIRTTYSTQIDHSIDLKSSEKEIFKKNKK